MYITENTTPAQQFCYDFLLVADNDFEFYTELREEAQNLSRVELSDKLREEYENLAEQVCELVEENISEVASCLMAQLLRGWGVRPFDLIAKELKERAGE